MNRAMRELSPQELSAVAGGSDDYCATLPNFDWRHVLNLDPQPVPWNVPGRLDPLGGRGIIIGI